MTRLLVAVKPEPQPRPHTVVVVPHAGAGVGLFSAWRQILDDSVDLVVARLPGREDLIMDEPYETMVAAVAAVSSELAERAPGSYVLYGHCSGGLVAYEVTRALAATGAALPSTLVLSSTPLPSLAREVLLHDAPEDELRSYMVSFSGQSGAEVPDELWELVEPTIRADLTLAAAAEYTDATVPVPIVVLRGANDRVIDKPSASAWAERTDAEFTLTELDGDHFLINTCAPQIGELLSSIAGAG